MKVIPQNVIEFNFTKAISKSVVESNFEGYSENVIEFSFTKSVS